MFRLVAVPDRTLKIKFIDRQWFSWTHNSAKSTHYSNSFSHLSWSVTCACVYSYHSCRGRHRQHWPNWRWRQHSIDKFRVYCPNIQLQSLLSRQRPGSLAVLAWVNSWKWRKSSQAIRRRNSRFVNARIRKRWVLLMPISALHFLRSICVTGGVSGGATRRLGASEIEIAVRENPSRLCREESTPRITISTVHLPNPSHHTQIFPGENLVVWIGTAEKVYSS